MAWGQPRPAYKSSSPESVSKAISERSKNFGLKRVPLDPASVPITFREPQEGDAGIVALDCETVAPERDDGIAEWALSVAVTIRPESLPPVDGRTLRSAGV